VKRATPCEKNNSNRKMKKSNGKKLIVTKRKIIAIKREK
jgi:hypothetical protein